MKAIDYDVTRDPNAPKLNETLSVYFDENGRLVRISSNIRGYERVEDSRVSEGASDQMRR